MNINKKKLEQSYWDALATMHPGYIEYFIRFAEEFLIENKIDLSFYDLPLAFQLAIFYEYLAYHACEFELDVCDQDEAIAAMENYFYEEKEAANREKQAFKAGEI